MLSLSGEVNINFVTSLNRVMIHKTKCMYNFQEIAKLGIWI